MDVPVRDLCLIRVSTSAGHRGHFKVDDVADLRKGWNPWWNDDRPMSSEDEWSGAEAPQDYQPLAEEAAEGEAHLPYFGTSPAAGTPAQLGRTQICASYGTGYMRICRHVC